MEQALIAGIPLRHKNTIAGRVTAAILRTEIDAGFLAAEPTAYKCALHDMGVPVRNTIQDATRDALMMRECTVYGRAFTRWVASPDYVRC